MTTISVPRDAGSAATPNLQAIADRLFAARIAKTAINPVRSELPAKDVSAAYQVQQINISRLLATGRRRVGRKIGLTSVAVQCQLGVDSPDFGVLLDDMDMSGRAIDLAGLISPRIEAEFALRLGQDILEPGLDHQALAACVEAVAPSVEIVDSATNWDIDIVDTIADNASAAEFVVGLWTPYSVSLDLPARAMRLLADGVVVSEGVGAATLGDPLNALAWLADASIENGAPLRAGEVILSGALGPMIALKPAAYILEIEGFQSLSVRAA